MGMNNVYYRFTHLVGGDYPKMPAKLRMNVMARPGVEKVDFELWSLAVSAINGCGMCMESHEKVVRHGRPDAGAGSGRRPHRGGRSRRRRHARRGDRGAGCRSPSPPERLLPSSAIRRSPAAGSSVRRPGLWG